MLKKLNTSRNLMNPRFGNLSCDTCGRICRVSRLEEAYNMSVPYIA